MGRYVYVTLVLAFVGIGVSLLILPRDNELALMSYRDKYFESAREHLEQQLASGDMRLNVVSPLTKLYLQYGEIDSAVSLMERFVEKNPENISARKELGTLYQYAQRPDDYIANLEKIREITPDEQVLQELSDVYNFNAQYDKQIEVLEELVNHFPDNPENFIKLSIMQASSGRLADASKTLQQLEEKHPGYSDLNTIELLASIGIDSGDAEGAFEKTENWLDENPSPEAAVRLADIFTYKGNPELALKLLEPFYEDDAESPRILASIIAIKRNMGQDDEAFETLSKLHAESKLPPELYQDFISLAIDKDEIQLAQDVVEKSDLRSLPDSVLMSLAESSLDNDGMHLSERIRQKLGEDFLNENPYVDAALSLAAKEEAAPSKVARVLRDKDSRPSDYLMLARIAQKSGYNDSAMELLHAMAPYDQIDDSGMVDIANLYIKLDKSEQGLSLFNKLKETRKSPHTELAWVLLSAANGNKNDVMAWLESKGTEEIGIRDLMDLYFIASDNRQNELALAAAERLYSIQPTDKTKLYLASAMVRSGKYTEALEPLRSLLPDDEAEGMYITALSKLAKEDTNYQQELTTHLTQLLENPKLPAKRKQEVVYTMLNFGEVEPALPYVRDYANKEGGGWVYAYEDILIKLGKQDELYAYRMERAKNPNIPDAEKRQIAYYMLDRGKKQMAQEIFLDLASRNMVSTDTDQLLYLWGPRPDTGAMRWIEGRAKQSSGQDRVKWARHLIYIGEPEKAVSLLEVENKELATADSTEMFDAYLDALAATKNQEKLGAAVTRRAAMETSPTRLQKMASLAFQENQLEAAAKAYERLLEADPENADAIKNLGAYAFYQSAYTQSKQYFDRYFALGKSDYESNFYYGELLWRDKDREAANSYYDKSLQQLRSAGTKTTAMRAAEAQILYRKGDKDNAFAIFRDLLAKQPGDKSLKADFIAVLLEKFVYGEAKQLLQNS